MLQHLRRTSPAAVALALLRSLFAATLVLAAAGDLDTTFSGDGLQNLEFGSGWSDSAGAAALQSDGKIVLAGGTLGGGNDGDFAVARLTTAGAPDTLFDSDGLVTTNLGGADYALGVAIQPTDQKILVTGLVLCGTGCDQVAVVRYNTDGSLDSLFDGDGILLLPGINGADVVARSDGKIFVATSVPSTGSDLDFIVYRRNSNGSPDLTFNLTGNKQFGFGAGRQDTPYSIILQGQKVLVGGATCSASVCDFALARLKDNGKLDPRFSTDGRTTTNFGVGISETIRDLVLQPNNMIVAAGTAISATANSFAVARYKSAGGLDTYFRSTGKKLYNIGDGGGAHAVALQSDGKILVAGGASNGTDTDFALIRLKPRGALDTAFSGDGMLLIDFSSGGDEADGMVVQGDGSIVLGGWAFVATSDFAAARILP